jgi:flagellar biosynthesis anti-sigma factor FlgM
MKIDQLQNTINSLTQSDPAQRPAGKEQTDIGGQEVVSLSKFAARIKQLAQQTEVGTSVDLDRINAIRQAIADGSYRISSEGIASGMLHPLQEAITKS